MGIGKCAAGDRARRVGIDGAAPPCRIAPYVGSGFSRIFPQVGSGSEAASARLKKAVLLEASPEQSGSEAAANPAKAGSHVRQQIRLKPDPTHYALGPTH
jgi:hypothetical protein